jgi:peptidoglycan/LPS O-acetylase OafA/YrhL
MTQQNTQIRPLTALRFIAAVYVVLFHTAPAGLRSVTPKFLDLGYCSVSFFFLLSGFVLAIAYLQRPIPTPKRDFWIARFARISNDVRGHTNIVVVPDL